MKLKELFESSGITFYHGSIIYLPVGTILTPRDDYEENWGHTDFFKALELYRPDSMLSHTQSVFMVGNDDDIDLAGGGIEYVFTVEPLGKVQKHDINWSSEISMLVSDGCKIDDPKIISAANSYWEGKPHYNESVWEYLTPKAKILSVEEY
jgi:hypothetical protein